MADDLHLKHEPVQSYELALNLEERLPGLQSREKTASPLHTFIEGLQQLGIISTEAGEQQIEQFLLYRQELLDWNTRMNLTAITNPQEVLIKHFLDSLSLLSIYDKPQTRLLDIGSGAGFPGLPLKMTRSQWHVTLLEATGKKVAFLQHMIETLRLQNIEPLQGRAEEMAHKQRYRAAFDLVTARAVASLPTLLEYASPFCRVGGQIILPKKGQLTEELAQGRRTAKVLGLRFKADVTITLPGLDDGRRLLVWEQQKVCPAQYPRSGATMAKKPLGEIAVQHRDH
ncbi:MAG: 16S rRNA (guanine(527)-N(7))-methyltransferase RsmG [Ktedonobacteraceae bacterium]